MTIFSLLSGSPVALATTDGASVSGSVSMVTVIVEGAPDAASAAVLRFGGRVEARLAIIDGLRATVPVHQLAALGSVPGVVAVTVNGRLRPMDEQWGDDTTGEGFKATKVTGKWQADHDQGSAFTTAKLTGAQDVWGKTDPNKSSRKLTGHGVGVALIDTGVSPVEGLATPGKIVNGPDLSFESQTPGTRHLDGFGHGTHMAGLIAGRDGAVPAGNENDAKQFVGMAPDAKILNVRVGTVQAAIDLGHALGLRVVAEGVEDERTRDLLVAWGCDVLQGYLISRPLPAATFAANLVSVRGVKGAMPYAPAAVLDGAAT